jgi:hypothetical protein
MPFSLSVLDKNDDHALPSNPFILQESVTPSYTTGEEEENGHVPQQRLAVRHLQGDAALEESHEPVHALTAPGPLLQEAGTSRRTNARRLGKVVATLRLKGGLCHDM